MSSIFSRARQTALAFLSICSKEGPKSEPAERVPAERRRTVSVCSRMAVTAFAICRLGQPTSEHQEHLASCGALTAIRLPHTGEAGSVESTAAPLSSAACCIQLLAGPSHSVSAGCRRMPSVLARATLRPLRTDNHLPIQAFSAHASTMYVPDVSTGRYRQDTRQRGGKV